MVRFQKTRWNLFRPQKEEAFFPVRAGPPRSRCAEAGSWGEGSGDSCALLAGGTVPAGRGTLVTGFKVKRVALSCQTHSEGDAVAMSADAHSDKSVIAGCTRERPSVGGDWTGGDAPTQRHPAQPFRSWAPPTALGLGLLEAQSVIGSALLATGASVQPGRCGCGSGGGLSGRGGLWGSQSVVRLNTSPAEEKPQGHLSCRPRTGQGLTAVREKDAQQAGGRRELSLPRLPNGLRSAPFSLGRDGGVLWNQEGGQGV